jgi:ABC-type nitrate/sulfonate/bicarbonate transport system substrate-binding protein
MERPAKMLHAMRLNLDLLRPLLWTVLVVGSVQVTYAAEPKVLNIAWTSGASWSAMPYRIAAERGYWDREGLKARFITFQGTNLMLTALLAGEVDRLYHYFAVHCGSGGARVAG